MAQNPAGPTTSWRPDPQGQRRGRQPGGHVRQGRTTNVKAYQARLDSLAALVARSKGAPRPSARIKLPTVTMRGADRRELTVGRLGPPRYAATPPRPARPAAETIPVGPDVSAVPPEGDEPAGSSPSRRAHSDPRFASASTSPARPRPADAPPAQAAADAAWAEVVAEFDAVDVALSSSATTRS